MTYLKILDINVDFLRTAAKTDFMDELRQDIERKLANFDDMEGSSYNKYHIIQLIKAIEIDKFKFLLGDISAKRLYHDVDNTLRLFKIKYPRFDYMNDLAVNAYFS
jgi:hypothetical protein